MEKWPGGIIFPISLHGLGLDSLAWRAMDDDDMPARGMLHDCYHLEVVGKGLIAAIRNALRRPAIDGETVQHLGVFLRLVEQLPKHDEETSASMTLHLDTGEGMGIWEAAFSSDGLELDTTESLRSQCGSDHFSNTVFTATFEECHAEDELEDWLWNFARMAEDTGYQISAWSE